MLTRREMLKWGVLGRGVTLLGSRDWHGWVSADEGGALRSPATTPFVQALPLPPFAHPVAPFTPNAPERAELLPFVLARHQGAGPLEQFYELVEERRFVKLHPELPPTAIWSSRDINVAQSNFALGPRLQFFYGMPTVVRQHNQISAPRGDFGMPRT